MLPSSNEYDWQPSFISKKDSCLIIEQNSTKRKTQGVLLLNRTITHTVIAYRLQKEMKTYTDY